MKKQKHNHEMTNILKVGIFALLMLAPLGAILGTTSYMAFNKNAELPTQETTKIVEHKPQTNEVNNVEDLVVGNWYKIPRANQYISRLYFTQLQTDKGYSLITETRSYTENNNGQDAYANIRVYVGGTQLTQSQIVSTDKFYIKYYNNNLSEGATFHAPLPLTEEELAFIPSTYETQQVVVQENANAFYYACNQVIEQPLFNWATETGVYTAINSMCEGLSIQNGLLPLLLAYWTMLTVIYVVIDIVIEMFKTITHLIVRAN